MVEYVDALFDFVVENVPKSVIELLNLCNVFHCFSDRSQQRL